MPVAKSRSESSDEMLDVDGSTVDNWVQYTNLKRAAH